MPDKCYIAPFEGDPAVMSDGDKQINRELAARLFKNVMGGKPGRTLDIGAKLPVFAAALHDLGCDAWAVEHEPIPHTLPVHMLLDDFEADGWSREYPQKFDFISMIHTLEHVYNPLAVIKKVRGLLADDGAFFVRSPAHDVKGIERDLHTEMYAIHPYVHCMSSVLQCLYETNTFVVTDSWAMDGYGQRDIVLRCA
jgi:hypothetical protein